MRESFIETTPSSPHSQCESLVDISSHEDLGAAVNGQSTNVFDEDDNHSLPEHVFNCFLEHGEPEIVPYDGVIDYGNVVTCTVCGTVAPLMHEEWSRCDTCGCMYCTECYMRWENFQ